MKKSPVRDKSGAPLLPQAPLPSFTHSSEATIAALAAKNLQLEADLRSLRKDHTICVEDCEAAYRKIKVLESQPAVQAEIKLEADLAVLTELDEKNCALETLNFENKQLEKENSEKDISIENQNMEIYDLKLGNKNAREISNKLNKKHSDLMIKFEKEKNTILKEYKAEIKYWRKELGEKTKEKIKLEEELLEAKKVLNKSSSILASPPTVDENSADIEKSKNSEATENFEETVCTICATPIVNYVQKYFLGEAFSPACEKCDDNSWASDDDIFEAETNVEDAKSSAFPSSHVNNCSLNDIEEKSGFMAHYHD